MVRRIQPHSGTGKERIIYMKEVKWKYKGHSLIERSGYWYALGKKFKTEKAALKAITDCVNTCNSCA